MTIKASESARRRHQREDTQICDKCHGSGRIGTQDAHARAVRRGQISYQKSLEPGAVSMRDRGLRGGRPRRRTLADLDVVQTEGRNSESRPDGQLTLTEGRSRSRSARKGG